MSEIQDRQNQRIIDFAERNFSSTTHEYGRGDMARQIANKRTGERIDPSRFNKDLDHDGRKGVDCSSLVYYALEGAGFNLKVPVEQFGTRTLFEGNHVTDYAKKHFDVLPASAKTDGSLKPGDLLMLKMPDKPNKRGAQHIVIFKEYDEKGRIHFFGSQQSTGPAEVVMTGNNYWDNQSVFYGALRPKENFIKPELSEAKPQSKYDEFSAMIKGLMNDVDGSYTAQLLEKNKDIVANFEQRVQEHMAQQTASHDVQENLTQQQKGFSRT